MEMNEKRSEINEVNEKMLALFLRRLEISEEIAAYKNENNLPILDRSREREILAEAMEKSGDKWQYAHQFFTTLFELSKARQSELYSAPTKVRERVHQALSAAEEVFP